LPLAAVETPLICEFVRERIRNVRTTLRLQQHASVASAFIEIEYVRVSDLLDWLLGENIDRSATGDEGAAPRFVTNGMSARALSVFRGLKHPVAWISGVSLVCRESQDC